MLIGVGKSNNIPINLILSNNKSTPWVKDKLKNITWNHFNASNRDLFIINKSGILHSKHNLTEIPNLYYYLEISNIVDQLINL